MIPKAHDFPYLLSNTINSIYKEISTNKFLTHPLTSSSKEHKIIETGVVNSNKYLIYGTIIHRGISHYVMEKFG